jgi:hypothetical protein
MATTTALAVSIELRKKNSPTWKPYREQNSTPTLRPNGCYGLRDARCAGGTAGHQVGGRQQRLMHAS